MNQHTIQILRDYVEKAKDVVILSHERPSADSIGSILTLSLALQSLGKKATIAIPDQITVEHSSYIGVNKIVNEIGKKNFVISLDYIEGSIEKVSYNIEGNKFNLVIEPRDGFESFSQDKVHFHQKGIAADLVIVVDTIHLGGLKKLYEADKEMFALKPVINIDKHPNNSNFGTLNIVEPQASSTIEIVYEVLHALGVQITQDMATNMLNALYNATNNFTSGIVSAKAFEIAAEVTKLGGKRFHRFVQKPVTASEEVPVEEEAVIHNIEAQPVHTDPVQPQDQDEAPADWLKPKIFKSSHLS